MKTDPNKLNQLRQAVEEAFGHTPGSPTDFDNLSLQIHAATKKKIGVTTLKRFWGYVKSDYNATYTTLSVLTRYVGYRDWDEFCTYYKIGDSNFSTPRLVVAANLPLDSIVKAEWEEEKSITIKKIEQPNKFEVIESTNIKLLPQDTLTIDTLLIGEKFIANDCRRAAQSLGTYLASHNSALTSLSVQTP